MGISFTNKNLMETVHSGTKEADIADWKRAISGHIRYLKNTC